QPLLSNVSEPRTSSMRPSSLWRRAFASAAVALVALSANSQEAEEPVIEAGKTVKFEYTLSLDDGSVIQTSRGQEPFEYEHGQSQILPALEQALSGLEEGDEKQVVLSPEQAYGPVNPEAFHEVPIEKVPENARAPGAELRAADYNGPIRVHEVKSDTIVLDFNHPLAGKALTFDVRIVSVQ